MNVSEGGLRRPEDINNEKQTRFDEPASTQWQTRRTVSADEWSESDNTSLVEFTCYVVFYGFCTV